MKRFYKDVALVASEDGTRLLLDERPVKTPGKKLLLLPDGAFAEAVADEWRAQGEKIDPRTMPFTRLANTVVEGVIANAEEVRASLCAYGAADHLCHWAEAPDNLVARQAEQWQPVLDWWARERYARFKTVQGIVAIEQDEAALARLREEIATFDHFALAALHEMTSLTGSVLLAIATARGALEPEAAWEAAHLDEAFQIEQWGEDEEAKVRYEMRSAAFLDAVRALRLLGTLT